MVNRLSQFVRIGGLAVALRQRRAAGLTLDEIAEMLGVSRRTADRYRSALAQVFPDMEFTEDQNGQRRWRLSPSSRLTPDLTSNDVALLRRAASTQADKAVSHALNRLADRFEGRTNGNSDGRGTEQNDAKDRAPCF